MICFSFYLLLITFVVFPDRKTDRIIKGMKGSGTDTKGGKEKRQLFGPLRDRLVSFVARFVIIRHEKRVRISMALERVGDEATPEEFYAEALLKGLAFFLCACAFLLIGVGVAAFASFLLGVALFLQKTGEMDAKLKKIKSEIADELPRFISVINYSLSTTRDLIKIFEKYLNICKPALKPDLQLLVAEMKSGNYAEALKRFDARIGIQQLSAFVSGLIDTDRGIDQRTFFYLMEENMNALFIENKKKELSKRPKKIKRAIIPIGICLFAMYIVPIAVQLIEGLDMFK